MNKSSRHEIALEIGSALKDLLRSYREGETLDYETASGLLYNLVGLLELLDPSKFYAVRDNSDHHVMLVELKTKTYPVVIARVAYRKPVAAPPAGTPVVCVDPVCIGISAGEMYAWESLGIFTLSGEKRVADEWWAPTLDIHSSKFTHSEGAAFLGDIILGKAKF